jgi:hypothetical protein
MLQQTSRVPGRLDKDTWRVGFAGGEPLRTYGLRRNDACRWKTCD